MKAIVTMEEAKQKLLELYQAKNPDITEIVIEGAMSIKEADKIVSRATDGMVSITEVKPTPADIPIPEPSEMMKLAASLQQVIDEGPSWSIKYLKGRNKGIVWGVSKNLANHCPYCPFIAMDDNDQNTHNKTYHKEQWNAEKQKDKEQLQIAKAGAAKRVEDEL